MEIEVYTMLPTPFRMGASETPAKTVIEEYERVDIGKGYFGVVFKNPTKKLWHIALEDCGALIGTMESRAALIKRTKNDVKGGDKKLMDGQIEMGKSQMKQADFIERDEWFSKFKGKDQS